MEGDKPKFHKKTKVMNGVFDPLARFLAKGIKQIGCVLRWYVRDKTADYTRLK